MLKIDHLHCYYGKVHALKGIQLEVNQGEIVTLIGANGAGKSTLLMSIFGNPRADRGHIHFMREDITHYQTHELIGKGIAVVPEGRRIFPKLTVFENLEMGVGNADRAHFNEDIEKVFALFPRLKERREQRGGTLSGGEQQMLAISRALMSRPKLLLLDEPSLGLAPIIIQQIFATIKELNKAGMTILLVEQNANQALRLANRGYVLMNGVIVTQGTGKELLADVEVQKAYLGGQH
jgi:branched-chain amino acid transport system ATP-binding protein